MNFLVFSGTVEVARKRPQAIVLARNGSYILNASWVHREDIWLASQSLGLRKGEAFLALGSNDHSHLGLLLAQILGCFWDRNRTEFQKGVPYPRPGTSCWASSVPGPEGEGRKLATFCSENCLVGPRGGR